MNGTLEWEVLPTGVRFGVRSGPVPLAASRWSLGSLLSPSGETASASPLLRLLDNDEAQPEGENSVLVPHEVVTRLSDAELKLLTLPPRRNPIVALNALGALPDANFALRVDLAYPGRTQGGVTRTGAFVSDGSKRYVLSPVTYELIESVEAFNRAPPKDFEGKMRAWGNIRALASDEVQLDNYLGDLRIAVASRFALRPFVNANGEADFDIDLLDAVKGGSIISDGRIGDFNRGFRRYPSVRAKYPVGNGMHVILDERVRAVLVAAHSAQRGPQQGRRDFLRSPHAHMRAVLPAELADLEVGDVFQDADLSDRVIAVGLYQQRVLPWLVRAGHSWLPPERCGLRVGDKSFDLGRSDVERLLGQVSGALASGAPEVMFGTHAIPVSVETQTALEHLNRAWEPFDAPDPPPAAPAAQEEPPPEEVGGRQVLQIHANLESVEYETRDLTRRGFPRALDGLLATSLMSHQVEALDWLETHYEKGHPGVLLADDMGLGKTLTALAFLAWLKSLQVSGLVAERPFLLVAPTGLLRNWADESARHLNPRALPSRLDAHGVSLRALRVSSAAAKELTTGLPVLDVGQLQSADWVLTTYETLRDYQHSFARVAWGCVVFDEAQKIKNPTVAMTDAAKAMNADFRIAMTGTPVENRLADLWSIVDAIHPGRLGALKAFTATYEGEGDSVRASVEKLRDELIAPPPLMIRRLKEARLPGLPRREFHIEREPMPEEQARAYSDAVRRARAPEAQILGFLREFWRVSLHPHDLGAPIDDARFVASSARMRVLFRCLDRIHASAEKGLVFVDDLDMQGVLAALIQRRYGLARAPLIISGEVAGAKRKGRVDEFQARDGFDVMVLSPRAAGVGLTITAANHVIHLTRWWNPAVEDQCNDRVYRIGQKKTVHVYLPCAIHPLFGDDSFDVKLHSLLEAKRSRSRDALTPPEVTTNELQSFFNAVRPPEA